MNAKVKKGIKTAIEIVAGVILAAVLILFIFLKTSSGPTFIFGKTMLWVMTESMSPTIEPKTYILVERITAEDVEVGDIITFKSTDPRIAGQYNTHRVVSITEDKIVTKGDHNSRDDGDYSALPENVIGRYKRTMPVMTFIGRVIQSPVGFAAVMVIFLIITVICVLPDVKSAALEKEADDKRKEMDRLVKEEVERLKREGVADTATQNDNDASDDETVPTDIPEKAEDKE